MASAFDLMRGPESRLLAGQVDGQVGVTLSIPDRGPDGVKRNPCLCIVDWAEAPAPSDRSFSSSCAVSGAAVKRRLPRSAPFSLRSSLGNRTENFVDRLTECGRDDAHHLTE